MLVAEESAVADGLLLLSYPLHPPNKPMELRTKHFSRLSRPAFFAHGTRDGFASIAEMEAALRLIPAEHALLPVEGAGHDLTLKKLGSQVPQRIAEAFGSFVGRS